ncbi:YjgF family protein Mmf1 [Schizosaccharomyces japonicus yFS275]|uniref:YjgF family protein Mmf1 n=1 Tax=Schizosaccharomyces japonicus (strain yFS275 / FY16936) TaxID=402676 RepID=B6JXG8_SCHJY|nr:YjgF family protein Mmf1 [Schizosaccharomyces japonicus yFS275]EEB05112.1 YjgF family protein Mmf1 [Schizosaccharomyces japonicus yFS275]
MFKPFVTRLALARPALSRTVLRAPLLRTSFATPRFYSAMSFKAVNAPTLSAAGPYSHATVANGMVYCSGQIPFRDGKLVGATAAEQAQQALENLQEVLEAAGSDKSKIVKVNIFLGDMADFASVNEVYAKFLPDPKPARSCVAVKTLPLADKGNKIEIECIAVA